MSKIKVLYLYSGGSRSKLLERNSRGIDPDTFFYGLSKLAEYQDLDIKFLEPSGFLSPDLFFISRILRIFRNDVVISSVALPLLLIKTFLPFVKTRWFIFNINLVSTLSRMPKGFKRRLLVRALNGADKILCLSKFQMDFLLREGLDPKIMHSIDYGIDKDFYTPSNNNGDMILAVGKDGGRDYRTFLQATKDFSGVTIVTSKNNLRNLEVGSEVKVYFDIPSLELRDLYRRARLVVVPLFQEGFDQASDCSGQTVVLDAMACGVPVIVSDRKWVHDYGLTDYLIVVPSGDPESLSFEIDRLNNDSALRDSLSKKGRKIVEACYNSQHMASQIRELI